ncbi:MAG: NAD(P)/FAD-dependent oxidoreductase, partial [Planctomycetota bacterium]
PRRLFDAVAASASLAGDVTVNGLDRSMRHAIVEAMKGLPVPVHGTVGWDHAEVTAGGLALREVNPRTMAVNQCPGLFVVGELLDLNGPIGGLSFQAAFATAQLAGEALAKTRPGSQA